MSSATIVLEPIFRNYGYNVQKMNRCQHWGLPYNEGVDRGVGIPHFPPPYPHFPPPFPPPPFPPLPSPLTTTSLPQANYSLP